MDVADKNSAPPGAQQPSALERDLKGGTSSSSDDDESDVMGDLSKGSMDMDEEFLKHAEVETGENLSDQTPGGLCLYDCSLSTQTNNSLSHFSHTFNDGADSNHKHIHDLSCSMLADGSQCCEEMMHSLTAELQKKDKLIKHLVTTIDTANKEHKENAARTKNLVTEVSMIKENFDDLTNLSQWSFDERRDENAANSVESFRLSSYIKKMPSQSQNHQNQSQDAEKMEVQQESRSAQTTPAPPVSPSSYTNLCEVKEGPLDKDSVQSLCYSFLSVTKGLKNELNTVRGLIQQPYENRQDFPMQKIMTAIHKITECHETEMSSCKNQMAAEIKHHHEVQSALKDEIKTLKMRLQEKARQRDNEVAELLKARLLEAHDASELQLNENLNVGAGDLVRPPLDDSFNSNSEEETFSNLSRMKVEYLKLTPSEYMEDEIIDTVHIPDSYRQILEDYKLKLFDMEKKFDANRRYLEEQTHDREVERDEFQHALESLQTQIEELKKENGKLYELNKQNVYQMEEYDARLKRAEEDEMDMIQKHEKAEIELKIAVEKIFELREIIRDLEKQVDVLSTSALQLKEQNQVLLDELDKQEVMNKKEQPVVNEQDTYGTLPIDVTEEIQTQLHDLSKKIESKINEMDNQSFHTRPNSSCSGVASAVSTEDISCRELAGRSSRNLENFPAEDMGALLLNEIRRLESQFESLIRFEDVLMKKMKDSELRCGVQKDKIEELEAQVSIYQENSSNQMLKIADLEGKIDALRFESSNQDVISSMKSRLGKASKQLEEFKILLASKEQELSQIKLELNTLKIRQVETKVELRDTSSQTQSGLDGTSFSGFTYEGVSPEKIRRMDSVNPLSTSGISVPNAAIEYDQGISFEQEHPSMRSYDTMNRSGGRGDGDNADSCGRGNTTIKELDENLQELQRLLAEKDKMIQSLKDNLQNKDKRKGECEEENVTIDLDVGSGGFKGHKGQGEPCVYETTYASDYEVDGDLLKYIGTKILSDGVRKEHSSGHGHGRVQETDLQIEIATLNTQIQQLKRALEDERKRADNFSKQLKSCVETKAGFQSQSPSARTPVHPVTGTPSRPCAGAKAGVRPQSPSARTQDQTATGSPPRSCGAAKAGVRPQHPSARSPDQTVTGSPSRPCGAAAGGVRSSPSERPPDQTVTGSPPRRCGAAAGGVRSSPSERPTDQHVISSPSRGCGGSGGGVRSSPSERPPDKHVISSPSRGCGGARSSPSVRAPVQKVISSLSTSDLQTQHRELVHQIEEGRAILNLKHKEILDLNDHVVNLERRLNAKVEHEQELMTRLNSTSSSLRRCEEHGRELSAKNIENIKEIRRLRDQLDKLYASIRNGENPVTISGSGNEYFEQFMRAKSHKKALAWQKKYLISVIIGYKSVLRQVGHGSEHPELLQLHIPLAPSAVGLLDKRSYRRDFRVVSQVVLATIRMKYMVNRWHKKRNAEGSPDSEYSMSRYPSRIDQNIRPTRGILTQNRNNPTAPPYSSTSAPVVNNNLVILGANRGNVDQISEYLSRFESIENEISSSLSRNQFPS